MDATVGGGSACVVRVSQVVAAAIVLALPVAAAAATAGEFHGAGADLVPTAAEAGYANRLGDESTDDPLQRGGFETGWDGSYSDDGSPTRFSEFGVSVYSTARDASKAFAIPQFPRWRRPRLLGLRRDVRVKIRSEIVGITGTSRQEWCTGLVTQRRNVITYTESCRETPPATPLDARADGIQIHRLVYRKMVALGG
jgi:hypothetical protein